MRYRLEFRESVRDYLRCLSLSRGGRVKLNAALIEMVAEVPDSFDPIRPTVPIPLLPSITSLFSSRTAALCGNSLSSWMI